jgi:siderophore synthetase component
MRSCYDDWGQNIERVPNELIYRDDYKRMPIHPWQY